MYLSARCRQLLGYEPREMSTGSDAFLTLLHLDDRARMAAALRAHYETGQTFDMSIRLKVVGGTSRWFRLRGDAVRNEDGEPCAWLAR